MEIELALPAINRPKLVEQTLSSLCKHLKGVDFSKSTVYVNIDPVPIIYGREKVIDVCKKYVGNVVSNIPKKKSNWCVSFKWAITQPKGKFFMFLNDDWEFTRDFNIDDVLKRLYLYDDVKQVAINNNWYCSGKNNPSWTRITKYKPDSREMMRGNPSFFKNDFIKKIENQLDTSQPGCIIETQMTKKFGNNSIRLTNENIYYCEDLGEEWKKNYGIPPPMVHECSNYKLCIYCGNLQYKYKCSLCNKNESSVLCSEECFKKHCLLFHSENENPQMETYKNSYEKYYKNMKNT